MCHKQSDYAQRYVIKVAPKGMRHCLEHYLEESVSDGQNYIAVGDGEETKQEEFHFLGVSGASRQHKELNVVNYIQRWELLGWHGLSAGQGQGR